MVYEIRTYNLIGTTLYTYKEMPNLIEVKRNGNFIFVDKDTDEVPFRPMNWSYSTEKPLGAINSRVEFLPYIADVTEDLPSHCKFEPKTYKKCLLMAETHGSCLQFYHEESKEVLRIALNSHTYKPV